MRKPRVLLDVDGVLAAFVPAYLRVLAEAYGVVRTPDEVTSFDIGNSLGLGAEQRKAVHAAIARPGFCRHLAVYPGAVEGVAELHRIADVYIVTSPWNSNKTWTYDREGWLAEHFGIPHSRVVHTSAKHLVAGDVLVDDKTSTLEEWEREHPLGLAVCWQTPHNRNDQWNLSGRVATRDWGVLREMVGQSTESTRG